MMNIPPSEAKQLTLAEYEGLMHHWNASHDTGEPELEPPSKEQIAKRRARLEAQGIKVLH